VLRVHRGVHGAIHLTGVRTRYSGPWIYNMYGDVVDEELGRTITFASAAVGPCPRLPPRAPTTSLRRCRCSCTAGSDPRHHRQLAQGARLLSSL
jgi:hypothetical protein